MDVDRLSASPIGHVVPISGFDQRFQEHYEHSAFVPDPLPDEVTLTPRTTAIVVDAALALGRLDQAGRQIPNPGLLRRPTLRREAQSTSALEGTYAPLTEVLEADLDEATPRSPEVTEILNYVLAAEHAFGWVADGRPITTGLVLDLHRLLLRNTKSDGDEVGRVRTIQVVIGSRGRVSDARFVPPPPGPELMRGLQDWIDWVNRKRSPGRVVVDAALAHYQFETLHPLNDGNGRIGRLLVVVQLLAAGVLGEPLLTVSPWFETRRRLYQDELQNLSETGDFDRWVGFFSEGIRAQAEATTSKIRDLLVFQDQARRRAQGRGRRSVAVEIAENLIARPVLTASWAAKRHSVTFPAANNAIAKLVGLGLLRETTGRGYGRLFACDEVIRILER